MWKPIIIGCTLHHHVHATISPNKSRETISCSFIKSLGPLLKISMKWQSHVHGGWCNDAISRSIIGTVAMHPKLDYMCKGDKIADRP